MRLSQLKKSGLNLMLRIFGILAFVFIMPNAKAQTTLAAGDISIIGFNTDTSPDNMVLLVLKDLTAGTVFYVNDNEVTTLGGTSFVELNEAEASFTVKTGQTIPKGTVLVLPWGGGLTSTTSYDWSVTAAAGLGNGEEIYVYTAPSITATTPTAFIFGVTQGANTGLRPNGLTNGTTWIDHGSSRAYRYNITSATYSGTEAQLLAAIGNVVNHTGATSYTFASSDWTFTIGTSTPTVNLSVSANTGTEAGTTAITVTATSSSAVTGDQTVSVGVSGTGITGTDYTLSNTTITILDGQTTGTVTFTVANDTDVEGTETATLTISSPSAGITLGATTSQNITITDDDAPPPPTVNLSVSANAGTEAGTTAITVTATASSAVTGDQTVALAVTGTNITAGDYSLSASTITILNGQTTGTVTFTVVDDILFEGEETATLTISTPSAGITLGATTTENITITDNDVAPPPTVQLSVSANTGTEAGATVITVTATASAAVTGDQTVNVAATGTNITAGDFTLSSSTITILIGQTTGTVTFTIVDDLLDEGTEIATLTISSPSAGITLGTTVAQNISITDNDAPPVTTLVAGDIAVIGYNTGGSPDNFAILILKDITSGTTFFINDNEVATAGGTSFTDLGEGEASFTVKAGQTIPKGTVIILPWGAAAVSTTTYDWSSTSGAGLGNNNEELYIYTASSITATTPTAFIYFAKIGTSSSSIPAGLTSGTTAISPTGAASRYKTATAFYGDCKENLLTFIGNTAANWEAVAPGAALDWTFTVLPACAVSVTLSVSANSGTEADATVITLTATASAPVSGNQTVTLQVIGAGITGTDYTLSNTTITILDSQTTGSVTFTIQDDAEAEGTETVTLNMNTPSSGIVLGAPSSQSITITDNDVINVQLSVSTNNAAEFDATEITITATASQAVPGDQTVNLTVTGTGITAEDYTLSNLQITIPNGGITGFVTFTIVNDTEDEGTETATLTISSPSAGIALGTIVSQTVVIADNDAPVAGNAPVAGDIIFNEYTSDDDANGNDFIELLVLTDGLDLRGLRISDNELTTSIGALNNGETVFVFGTNSYLSNVPKGTIIVIYTSATGVTTDINHADLTLVLAPGTGVTTSTDGLGGSSSPGLATGGDALYLYLPGPDGSSAGTDNIYLDYISWETDGAVAPAGLVDINLASLADNAYFSANARASDNDIAANWVRYDFTGTSGGANTTAGLINPLQSFALLFNQNAPHYISFVRNDTTVVEGVGIGRVHILVNSAGNAVGSVDMLPSVYSTATNSSDYTIASLSLPATLVSGQLVSFDFNITDDGTEEADEYVICKFGTVSNAVVNTTAQSTLYIRDNDKTAPTANNQLALSFVTSFSNGASGSNSAEISAYDKGSKRLFIANSIANKLDIVNLTDPAVPVLITSISLSTFNGAINSVAVHNGVVALALEGLTDKQANGKVVFVDINGVFISEVATGAMPDMITFNHAGTKAYTANEGEPNAAYTIDPIGSVTIIDVSGGAASATAVTIDFTAFNGQEATLRSQGIRIFGLNANAAQDFEPEYITISDDDTKAWVTLQENNALVELNLTNNTIVKIIPLGYKDHSQPNNALDASDQTFGVNFSNFPFKGMYLPDAIASYTSGGNIYLITANEGDARAYTGFNEESRVSGLTLDPTVFPNSAELRNNAVLGRLNATNKTGDTDNDGDIDEIYVYGSRSFSIWNPSLVNPLVYDSKDDLERITFNDPNFGAFFNMSNTVGVGTLKNRSDDKGPEPEGVVVAKIGGKDYAMIALERIGGVMVYDVTNPASPAYVTYANNRTASAGDRGSEGIIFIPATESPNGKNLVLLSNEVSSTISIYEINACTAPGIAAIASIGSACEGDVVKLYNVNSNPAYVYQWLKDGAEITGATDSIFNATQNGSYKLVAFNASGCVDTSAAIVLNFTTNQTWYLDADNDGYYLSTIDSCVSPGANYRTTGTALGDCNDNDANVYLAAPTGLTATGGVGTITASATGATEYSVNGTTYQPTGNFSGVTAGTYTVYARNTVNGCIALINGIVVTSACTNLTPPVTPTPVINYLNVCHIIGTSTTARVRATVPLNTVAYRWKLPAGVVCVSAFTSIVGQDSIETTTNFIDIRFEPGFVPNSTISVRSRSACNILSTTAKVVSLKASVPKASVIRSFNGNDIAPIINACPFYTDVNDPLSDVVQYTVRQDSIATGYTWSVSNPATMTIVGSATDTIVSIQFTSAFTFGVLTITKSSGCGSSSKTLTIKKLAAAKPGALRTFRNGTTLIAPYVNVCDVVGSATEFVRYQLPSVPAFSSSYIWSVLNGGPAGSMTIIAGGGALDNFVDVRYGAGFTFGSVRVQSVNSCSVSATTILTVKATIPIFPPLTTITGASTTGLLCGATNVILSTSVIATDSTTNDYVWTLPTGVTPNASIPTTLVGSVLGGTQYSTASNSIAIDWNSTKAGKIVVAGRSFCGVGKAISLTLVATPAKPAIPTEVQNCPSQFNYTYTIPSIPGAVTYTWKVPVGVTIVSGQGTTTLNVNYRTTPAVNGSVSVAATNACGTSLSSAVVKTAFTPPVCAGPVPRPGSGNAEITSSEAVIGAKVIPNPNNGSFVLRINTTNVKENAQIQVLDIQGRVVLNLVGVNNNGIIQTGININQLIPNGNYLVKYIIGKETGAVKMTIQR